MSDSFISYKNKGFWIEDTFVSLIARYLIEVYKIKKINTFWIKQMKDDLLLVALGYHVGSASLFLDKYLDNEYKHNQYIKWIEDCIEYLEGKGEYISLSELESFDHYEYNYSKPHEDLETKVLVNLLKVIRHIVNGELGLDNTSNTMLPYLIKDDIELLNNLKFD